MKDEAQEIPPSQPVTVAAAHPPQNNILTLALPIQQPRTTASNAGASGTGGGREDCWSEGATSVLIDAWGERFLELSRGNLKQNHWKDVAEIVSSGEDYSKTPKTDVQCKNRIDTLKKKYKTEKLKIASGQGNSNWVFFYRLDQLIGAGPTTAAKILRPQRRQYQKPRSVDSETSSEPPPSPDSSDSFPPETTARKRPRLQKTGWGNSIRELSQAILEFGQAYERTETSKLQQVMEMEKQRMGFAKELETQRMQFFMKTQSELTQLKHGKNKIH